MREKLGIIVNKDCSPNKRDAYSFNKNIQKGPSLGLFV